MSFFDLFLTAEKQKFVIFENPVASKLVQPAWKHQLIVLSYFVSDSSLVEFNLIQSGMAEG